MYTTSNLHVSEPPEELKYLKWCAWEWYWDTKKKKWTKPPFNPQTEERLRTNDPDSWLSYEDVKRFEKKGYLLGKDDLLYVIDMDGCRDPETSVIAGWAWMVIEALNSYTEVSPSGTGVHIVGYGTKPQDARSRFTLEGHEIEVYDCNRYVTFTGQVVDFYYSIRNGQDWLDENVPVNRPENITAEELALEVPELELTDEEIVRKLSSFSYGEKFDGLYKGDWEDHYPSQSEADLALCWYLAFMTKDAEQIDRIFRNSGLYRGKWEREDYRDQTINKALDSNTGSYVPSVSKQIIHTANERMKYGD